MSHSNSSAFLTTRVKKLDEGDWGKLKRVLKYLKGTKHLKWVIRWWVDALYNYNAHEDCRGQTGGAMMSLGRGAELVAIDDALPWILRCRYFMEAQGFYIEQKFLYQDNKSAILLDTNGRWFSLKRTKLIKSRYFFINDKVDKGEIEIQYNPTEKMLCSNKAQAEQGF